MGRSPHDSRPQAAEPSHQPAGPCHRRRLVVAGRASAPSAAPSGRRLLLLLLLLHGRPPRGARRLARRRSPCADWRKRPKREAADAVGRGGGRGGRGRRGEEDGLRRGCSCGDAVRRRRRRSRRRREPGTSASRTASWDGSLAARAAELEATGATRGRQAMASRRAPRCGQRS